MDFILHVNRKLSEVYWQGANSNFTKTAMSDTHRKAEKIGVEGRHHIV